MLSLISAGYWSCWLSVNWKCAPVIWYGRCESAHIHKQPFRTWPRRSVYPRGKESVAATPHLIFHVLLYYVAKTALLNDDNTKKGLWVRSLLLGAPHTAQIDHHGAILANLSIIYPAKCFINKIRHPIIILSARGCVAAEAVRDPVSCPATAHNMRPLSGEQK